MKFEEWVSQQGGAIEVDCGCVTLESFFHWLRIAYEAGNAPVIPDGLIAAVNRLLDSDGSRGCYSAIRCHDARAEVERLLAAAPQTQNIPEIIPEKEDPMTPADREYIVKCYSYTGPAWLHAGKDGPAWHFEGSDLLVDNDEVTVICKLVDNAEVK
ncbi:hypothetical protein [Klebsiella oxytoca]|uniref:hypothetical protein n=1 Tax=Klebsiella oxytoca TaxID=571 RepID=UPI001156C816|nr:hypothetical protein [Klebsiella oxytoca]